MNKSNATVEVQHSTFKEKIEDFLGKLEEDLQNTIKEVEFHKLIVNTFEENKVEHEYLANLKESIVEADKFIKALEDRKIQGKKLLEFLKGDFVLDFNKFAFLMIDVTGRQVVNYVELKNEYEEVSKLWTTEK